MSFLRAVGQFCYDLIVGDDWKIAAAVVTALGLAVVFTTSTPIAWRAPITAAILGAAFTVAIIIDTRKSRR
jgi:hypothetical protein